MNRFVIFVPWWFILFSLIICDPTESGLRSPRNSSMKAMEKPIRMEKGVLMGAAAVDLPDPLDENAISDGPAAGSDDLLSQLASDEIDRLLAEDADESTPPVAPASTADHDPAVEPASSESASTERDISSASRVPEVASPIAQSAGDGSMESASSSESAPSSQEFNAADLDATLAAAVNLKGDDLDDVDFTHASVQSVGEDPDFPGETEDTDAAARAMLAADDPLAVADDDPFFDEDDNAAVPLLLRPLVWLNAPLNLLPDPLRNAVGKVALITLFNALGVLTYVLIFRDH